MNRIQVAVDVVRQHRWLPMRRECTCGWHQRTTKSGLLNHPHHVADVLRAAGAIPAETEDGLLSDPTWPRTRPRRGEGRWRSSMAHQRRYRPATGRSLTCT